MELFTKWPVNAPKVGQIVQVQLQDGVVFETTVLTRSTEVSGKDVDIIVLDKYGKYMMIYTASKVEDDGFAWSVSPILNQTEMRANVIPVA